MEEAGFIHPTSQTHKLEVRRVHSLVQDHAGGKARIRTQIFPTPKLVLLSLMLLPPLLEYHKLPGPPPTILHRSWAKSGTYKLPLPPHAPLSLINNHGPCWACTPLRNLLRAVLLSNLCQPIQGLREQTKWTPVVSTTSQGEVMASMRVPSKERTLLTPLVTCVPSPFLQLLA